ERGQAEDATEGACTCAARIRAAHDVDGGQRGEIESVDAATGAARHIVEIGNRNSIDRGQHAAAFEAADIDRAGVAVEIDTGFKAAPQVFYAGDLLILYGR